MSVALYGRAAIVALSATAQATPWPAPAAPAAVTPIQHVVIIMQENRSFDHYFGTYPGADGITRRPCLPLLFANPDKGCVAPFHDVHDQNAGGPHSSDDAQDDLDNGIETTAMDGFASVQWAARNVKCAPDAPACGGSRPGILRHDAMGFHTADEIPNYWAYAQHFVLQDRMFAGVRSWSLPAHLEMTSEWAATCTDRTNATTCTTADEMPYPNARTEYPWANLFQFLDVGHVSWKYYLGKGNEPDCSDGEMTCAPQIQTPKLASFWNPLPNYGSSKAKGPGYLAVHNPRLDRFLADVENGRLPQVSWLVPADVYSEHPSNGVTAGMEYVTSLVNAIMTSPYWPNTAIFISWDDWGGFYDHVPPPNVDRNGSTSPIQGYGLRVPGLMISAYAKAGLIDRSVLSVDSFATFIEDIFLGGARLNPAALGNPDSRPDQRDALTSVTFPDGHTEPVGSLLNEFDFTQAPLRPLMLSTHIPTGITAVCNSRNPHSTTCNGPTVTLSWASVSGPQVPGPFTYHITRDGREVRNCIGSATTCTDQPGEGIHYYRAYSVDSANLVSPLSAAAEADEP
jgi:phospholipase C